MTDPIEGRAERVDRPPELERVEQGNRSIQLRLGSGVTGGRKRHRADFFVPRRMLMLLGVQNRPERESDHEQRN